MNSGIRATVGGNPRLAASLTNPGRRAATISSSSSSSSKVAFGAVRGPTGDIQQVVDWMNEASSKAQHLDNLDDGLPIRVYRAPRSPDPTVVGNNDVYYVISGIRDVGVVLEVETARRQVQEEDVQVVETGANAERLKAQLAENASGRPYRDRASELQELGKVIMHWGQAMSRLGQAKERLRVAEEKLFSLLKPLEK